MHIKLREKVAYGFGDAASSMFWKLFTMYLLFFYTDIFGIAPAAAGTMFLVTRIWDSVLDPIIGAATDRCKSRWGKFRPFLLWVAIPFGVIGVFTFTTPHFAEHGKLVYAYITYSLMMMIYSLINVPYASLLGVISPDSKVRTQFSSFRMIFAFIGSIVVLLLVEPLVKIFSTMRANSAGSQAFGWQMAAIVFAIIAIVLFFLCFLWTKERVKQISYVKTSLKADILDLLKNRPWWILLVAAIATLVFNSVRDGAAIYYFKYYIIDNNGVNVNLWFTKINLSNSTIYLVLGQIANIVGIILVTPVSNKIGKKRTYFFAMMMATILSVIFYFLGKGNLGLIMFLQILISVCAGSVTPLLWSMYADIADYSEWRTKRRATGLIFSSSSMSQKFGWTIGGALTGWLLQYFGFHANMIQSETVQHGLKLMLSFIPAVATLIGMVFIFFYPLSEKKIEEVIYDLNKSRNSI